VYVVIFKTKIEQKTAALLLLIVTNHV